MPKVLNRSNDDIPTTAVYVGRPSPYGNPFKLHDKNDDAERAWVLAKYRAWLLEPAQAELVERIKKELKDKDLVCWCSPKECHADVLLEVANDIPTHRATPEYRDDPERWVRIENEDRSEDSG